MKLTMHEMFVARNADDTGTYVTVLAPDISAARRLAIDAVRRRQALPTSVALFARAAA